MSTFLDVALLFATPDQWAGAVLLACALLLVHLGSRRPRGVAGAAPRPPAATSGFRRWLTPFGMPSIASLAQVRRGTPVPIAATAARRTPRTQPVVDAGAVTRLARAGSDAAEIARRTGLARDAVRLVLLRDGAPTLPSTAMAAAPVATGVTAPVTSRTSEARDRAPRDRDVRDIASSRRARTMPAIRDERDARDERAARDPRTLGDRARARAADAGRGTRFSATVR